MLWAAKHTLNIKSYSNQRHCTDAPWIFGDFWQEEEFCEISFVFLFLKPFLILLLKFCSDRGVTISQGVSIPPLLSNIQRNDEIPFIPSHWAWNHQHTIFKHFSQLFLEKIWSNLRRQMIRWSIKSALPKYWLGHKEGSKVGFCLQQFLYIRHLFKMCLMYFLCVIISSHPFCASKRGWHFAQKKYSKYLEGDDWAPNIREESFLIQNLSQKMSTLKWDSFGGWMAQKLKIPLLCYQITQTSWHALSEDIGHRVRISNWCHHRSQIKSWSITTPITKQQKTKQNVIHTFTFWGGDLDGNF